jgi:adenylylsulfate reductase subunit B
MPPEIDKSKCTSCGRCVEMCPLDVLRMEGALPVVAYPRECWHCGACMMDCTQNAIKLWLPVWIRPVTKRVK